MVEPRLSTRVTRGYVCFVFVPVNSWIAFSLTPKPIHEINTKEVVTTFASQVPLRVSLVGNMEAAIGIEPMNKGFADRLGLCYRVS